MMTSYSKMNANQSILIIGATGRTGLACLRQLAGHSAQPSIHVFCRDADKLADKDKLLCDSVVQGNARNSRDLERGLSETGADTVIVSIGDGDNLSKCDIREESAKALVRVLNKAAFRKVRVLVVSSIGAGPSKIVVGMGIGSLLSFHLRHILNDHSGQEAAFASIAQRTTIVRPTALTDDTPTGKVVEFKDREKSPTIKTDRSDVAAWVSEQVCGGNVGGRIVNITGVKQ